MGHRSKEILHTMEKREKITLAVDDRYIACCKLRIPPSENELYKCTQWGTIRSENYTRWEKNSSLVGTRQCSKIR